MATHVCKIEARNKLSKDIHVMNQTYGRTFVSIRVENRKQINFPSKQKSSFWEPTLWPVTASEAKDGIGWLIYAPCPKLKTAH